MNHHLAPSAFFRYIDEKNSPEIFIQFILDSIHFLLNEKCMIKINIYDIIENVFFYGTNLLYTINNTMTNKSNRE